MTFVSHQLAKSIWQWAKASDCMDRYMYLVHPNRELK